MTDRAMLIPAYVSPSGLIDLVQDAPRPPVVIINPHNGPGPRSRRSYGDAVRVARGGGARVLGYLATGYGARPVAEVVAEADRYASWYRVDGFFLDEVARSPALLPYYATLSRHVGAGGRRIVALNPGAVPHRGYFALADVVVTFEGPYGAYAPALRAMPRWTRRMAPGRIAHLVYGASRDQALDLVGGGPAAGYLYVTSGALPNPWGTVPPYLREQDEALRA
jgi:hypothetical protein